MPKQKTHNEYFRTISKKRCPQCKKQTKGQVWSWGNYICGKWNTVSHFCANCIKDEVEMLLRPHLSDCGCDFEFIGYGGQKLSQELLDLESRLKSHVQACEGVENK